MHYDVKNVSAATEISHFNAHLPFCKNVRRQTDKQLFHFHFHVFFWYLKIDSDGVIEMYQRWINNCSITCAYSTIDRERPYVAAVVVCKEKYVNHAPKCIGSNLGERV